MCGRYFLHNEKMPVGNLFREGWDWRAPGFPDYGRYNLAPSQELPVAHIVDGEAVIELLTWGFAPKWLRDPSKAQINARAETVREKPMFRKAAKNSRCLVPATGWYEWQVVAGKKQPYAIAAVERALLMFAGIEENGSFAILTTEAIPALAHVHGRMPRVLTAEEQQDWIGSDDARSEALLRARPRGAFAAWPVSRSVNSPKHDAPDCIVPVEIDESDNDE